LSIGQPASPNHPPVAVIAARPTTGMSPLPVTFDGKSSFDVDGHVASYVWDFGDGKTASGASVQHTYHVAGTYTVTLTVTDNGGRQAIDTLAITAQGTLNKRPVARLSATPATGKPPLRVQFDGTGSTDADGHVVSYAWDFGDGVTATGEIVRHTYNTAGDYTATLTVTDEAGATDVASVEITVAKASNGIDLVDNGSFEAVDGDGQPVEWRFGSPQAWEVISTDAFTGVRSLQLQEAHRQQYTPVASAMTVTLTPGTYTLGAWIATEALGTQDTERRGVRITLKNEALTSGSGNVAATAIVQGTHDWHRVSTRAVITRTGEYTVKIWAHGKPNGTAWIDAVSLIQE
jgi:PKD repeat protein